ncbi:hypothetical protein [Spiroplasma sp. AdecLV25b]|uniref:hypothetical protein n=1 Tax=Spiroplasma sp. AdecLV25b TaxID=3027162 RepID=UPI0027E1FCD3|nr:hypothetical protein [Spiroplasma sp. AdecLV25b]
MLFKNGQQIIVKENETIYLVVYNEQLAKFILIPCCSVQQLYEKYNKNKNWNFDCNDYIAVLDNKVWYSAKKNSIIEKFITSESYTNALQHGIEFHNMNISHNVKL